MAIVTVAHNGFRRNSLRFLEADDSFEVGMFVRLQDKEEIYRGTFLIVEIAPCASWSGLHLHLVLFPLGLTEEQSKLYTLIAKVKN